MATELLRPQDVKIETIGPGRHDSPLGRCVFVEDDDGVLVYADQRRVRALAAQGSELPAFERAGPRRRLFFDPGRTRCGVVTCGGLCPGTNDVVRSIVLALKYTYGVGHVLGFRYGYAGLAKDTVHPPLVLTQDVVDDIHEHGGTLLGTSRGAPTVEALVDGLVAHGIDVLFAIGGDGTLRGVDALCGEIRRRGLAIGVIGIPKTIDNDLSWIDRSFGFSTAVDEASRAIEAAHTEARGAWNGIGLVKLMGRHSGFIAAHATLANSDVNFCLIPEVPVHLDGDRGLLATIERRLMDRRHAVVVVAEGALQDVLQRNQHVARDASGNLKLSDVGAYLRERMQQHFDARKVPVTIKYIDPSYMVRSLPANALDSEYCLILGQHAVHAGMSGRTNAVIGYYNQSFIHVPARVVVADRKQLDPDGHIWKAVLEATGQPDM